MPTADNFLDVNDGAVRLVLDSEMSILAVHASASEPPHGMGGI